MTKYRGDVHEVLQVLADKISNLNEQISATHLFVHVLILELENEGAIDAKKLDSVVLKVAEKYRAMGDTFSIETSVKLLEMYRCSGEEPQIIEFPKNLNSD
ncbi:hypothetical protein AAFO92_13805 [Roseovarius sp. CAU 1744]|uniref:hypothetical protein n=1 Tax=Roseovarius sp. CAU 1744 TaxID=3140368 RepID=UPI00325BD531